MPVLFFVLWIILNGRMTLELVVLGIVISAGVTFLAYRMAGYIPENDLRMIRNFPPLRDRVPAFVVISSFFISSSSDLPVCPIFYQCHRKSIYIPGGTVIR